MEACLSVARMKHSISCRMLVLKSGRGGNPPPPWLSSSPPQAASWKTHSRVARASKINITILKICVLCDCWPSPSDLSPDCSPRRQLSRTLMPVSSRPVLPSGIATVATRSDSDEDWCLCGALDAGLSLVWGGIGALQTAGHRASVGLLRCSGQRLEGAHGSAVPLLAACLPRPLWRGAGWRTAGVGHELPCAADAPHKGACESIQPCAPRCSRR